MNHGLIHVTYTPNVAEITVHGVYQYDLGLKLCVSGVDSGSNIQMHYGIQGLTKTLDNAASFEDGAWVTNIPNILTAQTMDILCYVYLESDAVGKTFFVVRLPVSPREKPSGYQYTETELTGYNELMAQLRTVISETQTLKEQTQEVAQRASASADEADANAAKADVAAIAALAAADQAESLRLQTVALQQEVRSEVDTLDQNLRNQVAELDQSLRTDVAELELDARSQITQLDEDLRADVAGFEQQLTADVNAFKEQVAGDVAEMNEKVTQIDQRRLSASLDESGTVTLYMTQ